MNTDFPKTHSTGLFLIALVSLLLIVPIASSAQNEFLGFQALMSNTTGFNNTANGSFSLMSNTTGYDNTANGFNALSANISGFDNTASGFNSLSSNTIGTGNTAAGVWSLLNNTTGSWNAAHGEFTLLSNTTGIYNTAHGAFALYSNTTGSNNVGIGRSAGSNLTTGSNNIDIGNPGVAGESGVIRIGTAGTHTSAFISGINGVNVGGVPVFINANGQLGTVTSSRRFKNDIQDMGQVSEKLMQLRPVTFRYKEAAENGTHPIQYGLIAEEVAKVYPDLVQYDKQGKPFTIYYHLLTPMLLNELQKAHRENVAQSAKIAALTAAQTVARAETASLKSELAALKQAQQQQLAALAKLSAIVQTSQHAAPALQAAYTQH